MAYLPLWFLFHVSFLQFSSKFIGHAHLQSNMHYYITYEYIFGGLYIATLLIYVSPWKITVEEHLQKA